MNARDFTLLSLKAVSLTAKAFCMKADETGTFPTNPLRIGNFFILYYYYEQELILPYNVIPAQKYYGKPAIEPKLGEL
ncbi:hypothetical protein LguiB_003489 [Lonicera macranthoides]